MATPRRSGRLAAKEAGRGAGAGAPGGRGAATPARARGGAKVSEAQKQWAATAGTGVAETSWFSDLSTLFLVSVCPVAVFFFHYVYTVLGGRGPARGLRGRVLQGAPADAPRLGDHRCVGRVRHGLPAAGPGEGVPGAYLPQGERACVQGQRLP